VAGLKFRLYYCFSWIAVILLLALATFSFIWLYWYPAQWNLVVTLAGGVLSILYFTQKQKVEDIRLFNELFQYFNQRYDALNDDLNDLKGTKQTRSDLCAEERQLLDSYFNLCAEEFLFYKQGYIPPQVWKSWRDGMAYYMEDPAIRDAWKREQETQGDSYYELDMPEPKP
jgi:hypothetical protein